MKKLLALFLASALILGMAACGDRKQGEESSSESSSLGAAKDSILTDTSLKDGEYKAVYKTMALDRTIDSLTVKIEKGDVSVSDYSCKEESGEGSSDGTEAEMKASKAAELILDSYKAADGDFNAMEPVDDSAQEHFYRFQRMMREITAAAKDGKTDTIELGKYADGTYKATAAQPDLQGWTPYVEVVVADGNISSITYDALKDGAKITEDTESNAGENKPSAYYPEIVKSFSEGGEDLTKLFAPTGGGLATKSFVKLMTPVMASMVSGGEKEFTAPKYVNGTYRAEFTDFDADGWKAYLVLQIYNDKVTVQEFDAIQKDTEALRSQDNELSQKMKESTGTYDFPEAVKQISKNFDKADGDPFAVENVVGATISSNDFKQLAGSILAMSAVEGDTGDTLQVERIPSEKES
ncbi:MAG: hypothetical protein HFG18_02125 [Oscillospiraceae bacterium]|nr:hypothetical protein [Oscillospiraceae bacterium]